MNATLEEARNFLATVSGENIRAAGDYRLFRRHDPRGGLREGRVGQLNASNYMQDGSAGSRSGF
jgi:hypothetical protein